jgi:hypothetical protein
MMVSSSLTIVVSFDRQPRGSKPLKRCNSASSGRSPRSVVTTSPMLLNDTILARSSFRRIERRVHNLERVWTTEQIIGYLYSTSVPIRRLLGDQRTAFERALAETLHGLDQGHGFIEPVTLEVLIL